MSKYSSTSEDSSKEDNLTIKKDKKDRKEYSLTNEDNLISEDNSKEDSSTDEENIEHSSTSEDSLIDEKNTVYSLTFAERGENHKGMQIIGEEIEVGFSTRKLAKIKKILKNSGIKSKLIDLNDFVDIDTDDASILIIRNGINEIMNYYEEEEEKNWLKLLFEEQEEQDYDTKAFMYGRVVNKYARHNICYSNFDQEPNYEEKMGNVVDFEHLNNLNRLRINLQRLVKFRERDLIAEGNKYYDIEECGIGFHGDTERKIVICARLGGEGRSIPLHYQWFYQGSPIGKRVRLKLYNGDIYIMNKKAVGTDWKRRIIPTLRHAAGCKKFTTYKKKK